MHTYRKSKDENLWTVGYWRDVGEGTRWEPISDHSTENLARMEVSYLNGGARPFSD